MTTLLGISGSLRAGSYNTALVRAAAEAFAADSFVLADLNLPLFNEDVEAQGIPAPVQTLIDQVTAADAIVMSVPEYNKAPPGVWKNALDWLSRPRPAPMVGKPVALMSATAGKAGGERTKSAAYLMLIPFKVRMVLDMEVNVGSASEHFGEGGLLATEMHQKQVAQLMTRLREMI